jgi:hypothetical protein
VARTSSPFITIRSEGALLPPELLARIVDADKDLGGLVPTDYHLGENERLGEAIARSWNRLVGVWASFEASLDGFNLNEPGTGVTRERWLAPLFQELGFGRLQVAKARKIDGTDYPISHEWGPVPIHLVGAGVELERRTKGVAGAARMSPHALVQDYLNRTEALWGIVSNGRELRLLRDNVSLTRQAYLAFDLEAMFSGEVYADFALLWLACHQSRFEPQADKVAECWLERWTQAAQSQGTRALNTLRVGVEVAISTLGAGFVAHPANAALREALRSGELETADYYRELLRLVYRLIFLFVAEDRALLHPDATTENARARYRDFYSMTRLRHLAERLRGGPHPDLWRSFVFVCVKLSDDQGCEELGLPFLGSALFSDQACPYLDAAELANRDLLGAIRALAFTEQRRVLRQIDYRNMGSEELGSIYESLLELHPEVHHESGSFTLATAAGNERKTTGSYYTPTSLISALLDTALEPVLDEAASKPEAEAATLDLKVLDPACGSGHFLVAAAHRIAKRLAALRTDEPEPSPGAYRAALREVISRCIFGIDVNPMAVELCKVSLWMEAVEPGKPLSFLEHHIVCGNSLLGTTPALLAGGIPDEAFTALEGDVKETVKSLKARNKQERKGQASLFGEAAHPDLVSPIATRVAALEATPDDSPEALHAKQQAWDALAGSDQLAHAKLIADAWCAAFVIEKTPGSPVLSQGVLEVLERNLAGGNPKLHQTIRELATRYRFLHPHLAFPQVFHIPENGRTPDDPDQGWSGGFDLVLGNPPWERVKVQEAEWFAGRHEGVAGASGPAARKSQIALLETDDPILFAEWTVALRQADGVLHFLRRSGRFPLCGRGDINTYTVFGELMRDLLAPSGSMGAVLKTGIALDDTTSAFIADVTSGQSLVSLFDFDNRGSIFPAVHRDENFCLITIRGRSVAVERAEFMFGARSVSDLQDNDRRFALTPTDLLLINPNSRTVPVFRRERDATIASSIYRHNPVLEIGREGPASGWRARLRRMFDMTNDADLFRTREQLLGARGELNGNIIVSDGEEWLPVFEGKMVAAYDHRSANIRINPDNRSRQQVADPIPEDVHSDPAMTAQPYLWCPAAEVEARTGGAMLWAACSKRVTAASNSRTMVACIIPRAAISYTLYWTNCEADAAEAACLVALFNSFAFDYLVRQKTTQPSLPLGVISETAVIPRQVIDQPCPWDRERSVGDWIIDRVLELTYTSYDLKPFAQELGCHGAPFRWDSNRRALLGAELDAAFFLLYARSAEEVAYILDSFTIIQRRDVAKHGEYRLKRKILEACDAMTQAMQGGDSYQTLLEPPSADPRVAHARVP